jgi:pimeloyl-ACP methyl ester carboxylesterase
MPTIETNGIRTHYMQLDIESGERCEDLVMVHGLGTSMSFWYLPHAVELSKRYRVTLYDLRGHGRSSMPLSGYSAATLGRDLRALLDALGIERAHLVGHSFGGVVALDVACQLPGRIIDLVLAASQTFALRHLQRPHQGVFAEKLKLLLDQNGIELDLDGPFFGFHLLGALARLQMLQVELPPEANAMLGPLLGNNSLRTARLWLQLLESTSAQDELMSDDGLTEGRLRDLDAPVLALYGERSRAIAAGMQLKNQLPRATFGTLPGGHFFPSTQAAAFKERSERFWQAEQAAEQLPRREVKSRT